MPSDNGDSFSRHTRQNTAIPSNRALHAVGIPVIILSTAAVISPWQPFGLSRKASLGGLAVGLLMAGHAIEGNRPAILTTPTALCADLVSSWSFQSDPATENLSPGLIAVCRLHRVV